jgi:hypothetical protein
MSNFIDFTGRALGRGTGRGIGLGGGQGRIGGHGLGIITPWALTDIAANDPIKATKNKLKTFLKLITFSIFKVLQTRVLSFTFCMTYQRTKAVAFSCIYFLKSQYIM